MNSKIIELTVFKENLIKLNNNFDKLKSIFEYPRLYLSNHFAELQNKIDLEAETLLITKDAFKQKSQIEAIVNNWDLIISKLKIFQNACFLSFPNNKFDSETSVFIKNKIDLIKKKLENLNELIETCIHQNNDKLEEKITDNVNYNDINKVDNTENEEYSNMLNEIDYLIYSSTYQLQNVLFSSKSVLFLENKMLDELITSKSLFGKMIYIKDAFLGERAIENLM
jgi:hypothetical protein